MRLAKATLIWAALATAICVPIAFAAASPLLAWRGPIYILAGFAGIVALGLALVQPLLIAGYLPGLSAYRGRRVHHWIGGALVVAVVVHVGGLWITSPPDMIDALLFASPTPFSPFGVIAMWAIFAVALLAAFRRRLGLRTWRIVHMSLAVVIVAGSVVHAMLVEGPMETVSKAALCALVLAAAIKVMADLVRRMRATSRGEHLAATVSEFVCSCGSPNQLAGAQDWRRERNCKQNSLVAFDSVSARFSEINVNSRQGTGRRTPPSSICQLSPRKQIWALQMLWVSNGHSRRKKLYPRYPQ